MQHESVLTEASGTTRPMMGTESRRGTSRIDPAMLAAARRVLEHTRSQIHAAAAEAGDMDPSAAADAH